MCGELDEEERKAKVRAIVATLTEEQKKRVGYLLQGLNNSEIAHLLGKDVSSVRDMRARIKNKFKNF